MTIDEGVVLVATYLGIIDEDAINNMSFAFFDDILECLNKRVMYEAIANYAGNSFAKDSWDMIKEHSPFNHESSTEPSAGGLAGMAAMINKSKISVVEPGTYQIKGRGTNEQNHN